MLEVVYALMVLAAGVALLVRASVDERDRLAWALLGAGLFAWGVGDTIWVAYPDMEALPSLADGFYFVYYGAALAALWLLARPVRHAVPSPWTLLTAGLGLGTVWSWIVFDPVLDSVEGTPGAVATVLAYPLLDLLLFGAVLTMVAAYSWRPAPGLLALLAGLGLTGLADAIWVSEVAGGVLNPGPWLDGVWPIAAGLIAAGGWLPVRREETVAATDGAALRGFAGASIAVATAVLLWDHFEPFNDVTAILAALTLVAALAQLVMLYREHAAGIRERDQLEGMLAASAEASVDAIVTSDLEGRVLAWNRAAERIFGYSREEALGREVADLFVPPSLRRENRRSLARVAAGGRSRALGSRVETLGMRADGSQLPIEIALVRVPGPEPMLTAYIRDISDRKRHDEERERLSAMVRSTEDAMYSSTLDGRIIAWNPAATELYGYAPEEVLGLQMLSRLVPADLRAEADRNLRRVALGETVAWHSRRLHKQGHEIEVAVRYFPIRDEVGHVSGVTVVVRDISDRRRREHEKREQRERAAWRDQVDEALESDLFTFHAQPVVSLADGSISHHELLLRLQLEGETVAPSRFLPHVEQTRLMRRIDRWAISHGIELSLRGDVAINLSGTSLGDAGVVSAVERALGDHGADPAKVMFEITETAAVANLDDASSLVAALRELGCQVALDDFGTGYGSFTYLKRLDVTQLKIDMEFIRSLADDAADQRVVRSIVAVAQNFEIQTVAEGVEDPRALEAVREMGVDCAQGYLLGRPGPEWRTADEIGQEAAGPYGG